MRYAAKFGKNCLGWIVLAMMLAFVLTGCEKQEEYEAAQQSESVTPTGYDDDGVQYSILMCSDMYYYWVGVVSELPPDFYEVGKTIGEQASTLPLHNFEISRYAEGCSVYASDENSECVYVANRDGEGYITFKFMSEEFVREHFSKYFSE